MCSYPSLNSPTPLNDDPFYYRSISLPFLLFGSDVAKTGWTSSHTYHSHLWPLRCCDSLEWIAHPCCHILSGSFRTSIHGVIACRKEYWEESSVFTHRLFTGSLSLARAAHSWWWLPVFCGTECTGCLSRLQGWIFKLRIALSSFCFAVCLGDKLSEDSEGVDLV